MIDDLIFDIGMHRGLDTEWYLAKGFRVVAVDANPLLAKEAAARFADEVSTGRLIIENVGVGPGSGTMPFYVNLDNDEWSSFDKKLGTRDGTNFEVVSVPCINARTLFEKHGVPYFVKIDIEGFDHHVVRATGELSEKPKYLSVEDNGFNRLPGIQVPRSSGKVEDRASAAGLGGEIRRREVRRRHIRSVWRRGAGSMAEYR
jgi:FkbM family methyltransferase